MAGSIGGDTVDGRTPAVGDHRRTEKIRQHGQMDVAECRLAIERWRAVVPLMIGTHIS